MSFLSIKKLVERVGISKNKEKSGIDKKVLDFGHFILSKIQKLRNNS